MKHAVLLVGLASIGLNSCTTSGPIKVAPKPPIERRVSISAKLNFKKENVGEDYHYYTVELTGPEGDRSFVWPHDAPKPGELNKNKSYQLDLVEEKQRKVFDEDSSEVWSPDLVKLHDGQKLLYDASVCAKHQVRMDRKLVKITYGLISLTPEWKAIIDSAPHEGNVYGGCSVDLDTPEAWTWVCPVCKSTYHEGVARMLKKNQ